MRSTYIAVRVVKAQCLLLLLMPFGPILLLIQSFGICIIILTTGGWLEDDEIRVMSNIRCWQTWLVEEKRLKSNNE